MRSQCVLHNKNFNVSYCYTCERGICSECLNEDHKSHESIKLSELYSNLSMAIDVEKRRPMLSTITGGLSGPCIRPIAVRMVWQVAKAVKVPVVGLGGIMNGRDAIEFMLAGATAVQIGTANFVDPQVTIKAIDYIEDYLKRHHLTSARQLIGAMEA